MMYVEAFDLRELNPSVPDGTYNGVWSGYQVTFNVGSRSYIVSIREGVRGFNIPCSVSVEGGNIHVTT